jgi:hypothetical protein
MEDRIPFGLVDHLANSYIYIIQSVALKLMMSVIKRYADSRFDKADLKLAEILVYIVAKVSWKTSSATFIQSNP